MTTAKRRGRKRTLNVCLHLEGEELRLLLLVDVHRAELEVVEGQLTDVQQRISAAKQRLWNQSRDGKLEVRK